MLVVGAYTNETSLEDGGVLSDNEAKVVINAKEASSFTGKFAGSMPAIVTPEGRTVLLYGLGARSETMSP